MSGNGRVALITGGARRIGAAVARDLACVGWTVAIHHHRSAADAQALVAGIEGEGGSARAFAADLASEAETLSLVGRVGDALGPVTALINNASLFERDEALTATRDSWDRHMQINLRAPFVLSQAFVRQVPDAGGAIVNLLDQRIWNLTPHFTSYTVSKVGLWTLTQTLAMALAPRVRVNAVGPGPTLPSIRQSVEQFVRQWEAVPLARPAAPEEIAAAVRFLLDAPSVTGQMIAVDGGQHLGWTASRDRREAVE
jgi:NAD(P)-dependent dehydrogenase (short-subunit alcohol dehydrogenase family)